MFLQMLILMVYYYHILRWWNGIHDGLKIRWRKPYEFESRLEDLERG